MTNTRLVEKHWLSDDDIVQIRELEATCRHHDGIGVKFNWDLMLARDKKSAQDFCWYENGRIVGYAPLDGLDGEFEVTGAVLPFHRRRGIFRQLFAAARAKAMNVAAHQLLLVSYPQFQPGTVIARKLGTDYLFSEYHMEAESASIPPLPQSILRLFQVTPDEVLELSYTLGSSFGGGRWNEPDTLLQSLQKPEEPYFLAKRGTETVGQIGTIIARNGVYLRAIGIVPERRRQGLGRQMLAATVHQYLAKGHTHFSLDVETNNAQALSLYHDCGFYEAMVYDYSCLN